MLVACPVIFVGGGIHVGRQVLVVIGGEYQIETIGEQVAFVVFQRGHQGMAFAMFFAVDRVLAYTRLYILVHIGISETEQQAVGPFPVDKSQFSDDGFVMVSVVEAFHTFFLIRVETSRFEILYRGIYIIVVVRIVLESIDFVSETVIQCLSEVDV